MIKRILEAQCDQCSHKLILDADRTDAEVIANLVDLGWLIGRAVHLCPDCAHGVCPDHFGGPDTSGQGGA